MTKERNKLDLFKACGKDIGFLNTASIFLFTIAKYV